MSNTKTGGVWSTSNTSVATISATGAVTGVHNGVATISYTKGGYSVTAAITVDSVPVVGTIIAPSMTLCAGVPTAISNTAADGIWSSMNSAVATITSAGVVWPGRKGALNTRYTVSNSCGADTGYFLFTVDSLPDPGVFTALDDTICVGGSTTVSSTTPGGMWYTGSPAIAAVSIGGVVTALSAGVASLQYFANNSCGNTIGFFTEVVEATPVAGPLAVSADTVCVGDTLHISAGAGGGAWSSSSPPVAAISSAGVLTALAGGTTSVTYIASNTCGTDTASQDIVIETAPVTSILTATNDTLCSGDTASIISTEAGGVWSTASVSIATITTGGILTGVAAGTSIVSFTKVNSCGTFASTTNVLIEVTPVPGSLIATADSVCVGDSILLTNTVPGGVWAVSSPGVATIAGSGWLTGVSAGTDTVFYQLSNDCGADTGKYIFRVSNACATQVAPRGASSYALNVYPDPSDGQFTVLVRSAKAEQVILSFVNSIGQQVAEVTAQANHSTAVHLDVPPGVYIMSAKGGDLYGRVRIVIQ